MGEHAMSAEAPSALVRVLAVVTLVSSLALIVLGSAVRVTDSGMGCRGWPLCSGRIGLIPHFHPLMEQSHRFLASLVSVAILALALAVWRSGESARHMRVPVVACVGVLVVQIVLGALTVWTNNAPVTVALHLLSATLFLGVVSVAGVASFVPASRAWSLARGPGRFAWITVAALYLVVVSGSVVVNAGAQAACTSWPICLSSPAATGLLVIQNLHRSLVLVGSIIVVRYLVVVWRSDRSEHLERVVAVSGLGLLAGQIVVGALSAIETSHTELADVHLALAAALWSVVVAEVALCSRARGYYSQS